MRGIWWVNLNEEDLKQAQDILTEESSDTIDDLGFGSVRDLISEMLFPATSTIMTELRYLIFVPAIFRELERRQLKGIAARIELENMEEQLRNALEAGGEKKHIIGYDARRPQRIPSDIYWAAMRTLGIHSFKGSRFRYLESMNDSYYKRINEWRKSSGINRDYDDRGPEHFMSKAFPTNWEEISSSTSFMLTPQETDWLKTRFESVEKVNRSFFVHLMRNGSQVPTGEKNAFWHFYNTDNMPEYGTLIHDARCYSYLQLGSQHMYNLLLKPSDRHLEAFETWRSGEEFDMLAGWDYASFRKMLECNRIGNPTLNFHEFWLQAVLQNMTTSELKSHIKLGFEVRERRKKGAARSRLINPERALNYHFPIDRYQFRWDIAHRFLTRLCEGGVNP